MKSKTIRKIKWKQVNCLFYKLLIASLKNLKEKCNFNIENLIPKNEKNENNDEENLKFDSLSRTNELAYSVGHFLNDLTATGWMNYMLIYLSNINPITNSNASAYAGYYYKII